MNEKSLGTEPAFPFVAGDQSNLDDRVNSGGLTKREYFAGVAMQGLCASIAPAAEDAQSCARAAVAYADALLTTLNKNE